MYDRKNDPNELTNVISDSKYKQVVDHLKIKLIKMREKYGDSEQLDSEYVDKYLEKIHHICKDITKG